MRYRIARKIVLSWRGWAYRKGTRWEAQDIVKRRFRRWLMSKRTDRREIAT